MNSLVVDTHAVLWYLADDPRLSGRASQALDQATASGCPIFIPTICIAEATYLIEKGRIEPLSMVRLDFALNAPQSAFQAAPLNTNIAFRLKEIARTTVPDLPDRIIAATALALGFPLVTRDGRIQASNIETIW